MNPDAEFQPPFADFMGMKITHVSKDKVVAEMTVREVHNNRFGTLHGGAVMALADNLGGTATVANLPPGGTNGDDRKQDQFFRRHSGRRHGLCRMHAVAPRPLDDGLADADHQERRPAVRAGDPDADRHVAGQNLGTAPQTSCYSRGLIWFAT